MRDQVQDSTLVRVAKISVKAVGLLLVFGTIIFFLWRAFVSTIVPDKVDGLAINDTLYTAWQTAEASGQTLTLFGQAQGETTSVVDKNYSYFTAQNVTFIQEADQVQVLFRYNNSTLKHLKEDYGLAENPNRDEDHYEVTLVVVYDTTPEDESDNLYTDSTGAGVEVVRLYPTDTVAAQSLIYNYRRLTFDGVDMDNEKRPVLAVFVDVYYKEDVNYEKDAYGTLRLYHCEQACIDVELTGKEQKSLAE